MGKTEGSNEGPFSWIKGIKLKKTQHLDFIIKENGLVKRINTIFSSRLANNSNNGDRQKKTPQRLPLDAAGGVHRRPRMSCPHTY
jgi:hypothetical protein